MRVWSAEQGSPWGPIPATVSLRRHDRVHRRGTVTPEKLIVQHKHMTMMDHGVAIFDKIVFAGGNLPQQVCLRTHLRNPQ